MQVNRSDWLKDSCAGFVTSAPANRNYYKLILETLWPPGHSIPGPVVSLSDIRQVIDNFRGVEERYKDVPRRIRELQGEEGFVGIQKYGNGAHTRYQLVNLEIGLKRTQRIKLSNHVWNEILTKYQHKCAVCGREASIVRLDQDHKIPRLRGGDNEAENWQPLCGECNNFKSTACRGCHLDCNQCPWAFPEEFAPIKISPKNIKIIKAMATQKQIAAEDMLDQIIQSYLQN